LLVYAVVAGVLAGVAGCSGPTAWRGGERVVLAVQTGVTDGPTINRHAVIDTGLPPLHDFTGHPVRLLWVEVGASARRGARSSSR